MKGGQRRREEEEGSVSESKGRGRKGEIGGGIRYALLGDGPSSIPAARSRLLIFYHLQRMSSYF